LFFSRLGQQVGTGGGRGGAGEGKEEGREGQGNTGEGWGKWPVSLSAEPKADKRDAREDGRAVRTDAFRTQI
jgi:hypothetical protein